MNEINSIYKGEKDLLLPHTLEIYTNIIINKIKTS